MWGERGEGKTVYFLQIFETVVVFIEVMGVFEKTAGSCSQ